MNKCYIVVIVSLVVLILAIFAKELTSMKSYRNLKDLNSSLNLEGKNAVVVGGTSGIGHGIALRLAEANANIIIVGRNEKRGNKIVEDLKQIARKSNAKMSFVSCDCFLLKNVNNCVERITERLQNQFLDILVMSQGMATIQGFTPSKEEGLDQKLMLHVFSRAGFAIGLLGLLKRSPNARVLSILSAGIHSAYENFENDVELCKQGSYSLKTAANSAGFYNDIIADSLSRENPGISFVHASPGFISTNWGTEMPSWIKWPVRLLQKLFARSKEFCGEYMIHGLFSSGDGFRLMDQYGEEIPNVLDLHEEAREPVWNHIRKVIETGKSVDCKISKME